VRIAADAILAARAPHAFMGMTKMGMAAIFETRGNDDCHVILRGGKAPNFDADSRAALKQLIGDDDAEGETGGDFADMDFQPVLAEDTASQPQRFQLTYRPAQPERDSFSAVATALRAVGALCQAYPELTFELLDGQQAGQDAHGVRGRAQRDPPVFAGGAAAAGVAGGVGLVGGFLHRRLGPAEPHPLEIGVGEVLVDQAALFGVEVADLAHDRLGEALTDPPGRKFTEDGGQFPGQDLTEPDIAGRPVRGTSFR